jgi:hypothetical protein
MFDYQINDAIETASITLEKIEKLHSIDDDTFLEIRENLEGLTHFMTDAEHDELGRMVQYTNDRDYKEVIEILEKMKVVEEKTNDAYVLLAKKKPEGFENPGEIVESSIDSLFQIMIDDLKAKFKDRQNPDKRFKGRRP